MRHTSSVCGITQSPWRSSRSSSPSHTSLPSCFSTVLITQSSASRFAPSSRMGSKRSMPIRLACTIVSSLARTSSSCTNTRRHSFADGAWRCAITSSVYVESWKRGNLDEVDDDVAGGVHGEGLQRFEHLGDGVLVDEAAENARLLRDHEAGLGDAREEPLIVRTRDEESERTSIHGWK